MKIRSIEDIGVQSISLPELLHMATNSSVPSVVFRATLSPQQMIIARAIKYSFSDPSIEKFAGEYASYQKTVIPEQSVYLINRPCYLVLGSGVILDEHGTAIRETLYPSSGTLDFKRLMGDDIKEDELPSLLDATTSISSHLCVPLCSRWSSVYFHAITESLTQDFALNRIGLSEHFSYIAPVKQKGSQQLLTKNLAAPVIVSGSPVVRLEKVVFTSLLYGHAPMADDFRLMASSIRERAGSAREKLGRRLYVSRAGFAARQMENESELKAALGNIGFEVFTGHNMSLQDQAKEMATANVIIGAHGAGLTNAAFAQAGSKLLELRPLNRADSSPMRGASYYKLSGAIGLDYYFHISRNEISSEKWSCDIESLMPLVVDVCGDSTLHSLTASSASIT